MLLFIQDVLLIGNIKYVERLIGLTKMNCPIHPSVDCEQFIALNSLRTDKWIEVKESMSFVSSKNKIRALSLFELFNRNLVHVTKYAI